MAIGIEELSKMQVTGPVEGGDMVAKPDEMPVGAAALLNKMQKKPTPGVFKLPEADNTMPSFMQVAAEGIKEDTTQMAGGDTYNVMAGELLREGFEPNYIKSLDPISLHQLYEQTFGSSRDAEEMTEVEPTDWRTILKMIQSGMSQEEIEEQLAMKAAKDDLHMKAAAVEDFAPPDHQLAYITPEEGDILQLLGGSGDFNKMTGVQTFGREDYIAGQNMKLGSKTPKGVNKKSFEAAQDEKAHQTVRKGGDIGDYKFHDKDNERRAKSAEAHYDRTGKEQTIQDYADEDFLKQVEADQKTREDEGALDKIMGFGEHLWPAKLAKLLDGAVSSWEEEQVRDLLKTLGTEEAATGWGNLLRAMQDQTTGGLSGRGKEWFKDRGDLADEVLGDPSKDNEWADMNDEEKFQTLISKMTAGGGKQFEKNFNPDKYWSENPPKTAQDFKDMAQAQKSGKLTMNRDNTVLIEQGRKLLQEDRPTRDSGGGGGRGVEEVTEVVDDTTITPDERAGAFNVGGTMPYTHDTRTAGDEMNVPLGRRFEIDKAGKFRGGTGMSADEAFKYATLGGYSQLEPFQEYLTRRRKHLGEEEPEYFDEEGNVIYSSKAT